MNAEVSAAIEAIAPREKIVEFCGRWRIAEFALFGSAARGDLGPDSDVDVLVTFEPDAPWSLLELVEMQDELKDIFSRDVDLIEEDALKNPYRRRSILRDKEVIYAAR